MPKCPRRKGRARCSYRTEDPVEEAIARNPGQGANKEIGWGVGKREIPTKGPLRDVSAMNLLMGKKWSSSQGPQQVNQDAPIRNGVEDKTILGEERIGNSDVSLGNRPPRFGIAEPVGRAPDAISP